MVLSAVLAFLASYIALDLVGRLTATRLVPPVVADRRRVHRNRHLVLASCCDAGFPFTLANTVRLEHGTAMSPGRPFLIRVALFVVSRREMRPFRSLPAAFLLARLRDPALH